MNKHSNAIGIVGSIPDAIILLDKKMRNPNNIFPVEMRSIHGNKLWSIGSFDEVFLGVQEVLRGNGMMGIEIHPSHP